MKNWKIGVRLGLGFGLLITLMVVLVAVSYSRLQSVNHRIQDIVEGDIARTKLANDMVDAIHFGMISSRDVIIAVDAQKKQAALKVYNDADAGFTEAVKKLTAIVVDPIEKAQIERIVTLNNELVPHERKVLELGQAGQVAEAGDYMNRETVPRQENVKNEIFKLIQGYGDHSLKSYKAAEQDYGVAITVLLVVTGIAIALGILIGWLITQSVVQPIRQAVKLAEGVAAGDLTQKIETDRGDETGQLIKALRLMNDGLVQIVGDIRQSVETINTASQEIAAGNIDLSQRTEEQAASLEETAASMEELTSTVKQNAENAKEANQVAESASEIAQKGGEVVGQVVNTMAEINESSKKIVDIIGVIDGIAFQTNILALNAAVEAARAGEQGRGFAVVAGEVRSLAQRSAAAAKEIKTLIGDSVDRVTTGTAQVDRAGITMEEVVGSIRRVTGIMADISAASAEQSAGIEQVNTAVTQMDEVTQQNAALVEEAAAAAGSMQDQAQLLMEAVNRFKLEGVAQMRSHAPAHKPAARPAIKAPHKPLTKSAHPVVAKSSAAKHDDDDWSEF
ncbi:methyl-accepting chemotaxis protein [Chitinimonas sp. BJYL2]|uniref:methyl-accepting chemotaxis protein n=1 Tax=Chitinimonas sp. BJYL2 TaxID=2976696 RepID=UPI0022B36F23|nr:methyl-accepting chemotaxis protein [Chitinimonas sp. BJYL2]